jgi:ABC-2 type transport system permease protein
VVRLLAIAWVELVRLLRDRSNLFFVLVLPLLLVVLIGAQFGGSMDSQIGVVGAEGDPAVDAVVADLEARDGITTVAYDDRDTLLDAVSRNLLSAGLVLPGGFGEQLRAGEPVEVAFIAQPDAGSASLRAVVEAALAEPAAIASATVAAAEGTGVAPAELEATAQDLRERLPRVEVTTDAVGGDELAQEFAGLGQFDLGASTQLVLFTFLTAMTGSAALIQTRKLGVATRMASTPTPIPAILGGQAAGRIAVALFQALYIIVTTLLLFGVNWGSPLATGAVVLLFAVAAGAAGMLIGSIADNDAQAGGLGVGLGIGLAALGGSMLPLEFYPPGMRLVAAVTPHYWANQAMADIVRRDATIVDVLPQLAMLAVFCVVLLGLATWRLYRALIR